MIKTATGLTLSAGLVLVGIGALPADAAVLHVKPGQQWTAYANGSACEVVTIQAGHKFVETSGSFTDSGTYTGGARTITLSWTAGVDSGTTMTGHWNGVAKDYNVRYNGGILTGSGTFNKGSDPLGRGTCF
jgi:hypothetical protein